MPWLPPTSVLSNLNDWLDSFHALAEREEVVHNGLVVECDGAAFCLEEILLELGIALVEAI